jgi:hypothetical protein
VRTGSQLLIGVAVMAGGAMVSAFFFAAFFAPGWPRSAWGWLMSAALGLPLLILADIIITLCFTTGPPRYFVVARHFGVFRYRAGSWGGQLVMLAIRILACVALCALVLWLLYGVLFRVAIVRTQFR